jgi:hypothetical protein
MRRSKPASRPNGIGNVTLEGKHLAKVRYHLRHRQMVDDVQTGEGRIEGAVIPVLIDGDIEILEGKASLYSDALYTLHLEDTGRRHCDFYSDPIDIVEGRYQRSLAQIPLLENLDFRYVVFPRSKGVTQLKVRAGGRIY